MSRAERRTDALVAFVLRQKFKNTESDATFGATAIGNVEVFVLEARTEHADMRLDPDAPGKRGAAVRESDQPVLGALREAHRGFRTATAQTKTPTLGRIVVSVAHGGQFFLRRLMKPMPARPRPSRLRVAGSGTAGTDARSTDTLSRPM